VYGLQEVLTDFLRKESWIILFKKEKKGKRGLNKRTGHRSRRDLFQKTFKLH